MTCLSTPSRILVLAAALALSACSGGGVPPAETAPSGPTAEVESDAGMEPVLPLPEPWTGDLDGMIEKRRVRILTPYSRTFYYIDLGRQKGTTVELGYALEEWLNKKYARKITDRIHVVFIPTSRDRLLPDLEAGLGDIAIAGLTITPERLERVDFASPIGEGVCEVVVTGPGAPPVASLDDLGGKEIFVRRSSSYWEHLEALNARRKAEGKEELTLQPADEALEDDDILAMANAGLVSFAVVDDYLAKFWAQVYTDIVIREDLAVNEGGKMAWAIRKGSPKLLQELDAFLKEHRVGTAFGNIVLQKYLGSPVRLLNATSKEEMEKYRKAIELFRKYGQEYDFDPLMLAAQGYQESRLDQSVKSPVGAVGVMQVLPRTAEAPPIEIQDVDKNMENNIHAGAKYLRHLVDQYLDDPALDRKNRTLLAFAAYNAGPGNLQKFRALAKKSGLDPNVWFKNVEIAAARVVGQETVQYVANIYKYYVAYTLATAQWDEREKARQRPQ